MCRNGISSSRRVINSFAAPRSPSPCIPDRPMGARAEGLNRCRCAPLAPPRGSCAPRRDPARPRRTTATRWKRKNRLKISPRTLPQICLNVQVKKFEFKYVKLNAELDCSMVRARLQHSRTFHGVYFSRSDPGFPKIPKVFSS